MNTDSCIYDQFEIRLLDTQSEFQLPNNVPSATARTSVLSL